MAPARRAKLTVSFLVLLLALPALASAQSHAEDASSDVSATDRQALQADDGGETPDDGDETPPSDEPPPKAPPAEKAPAKGTSIKGKNAFEVWQEEHRWFRLGFRAYAMFPTIQETAALKVGSGLQVPLTTDFFMGLGMKLSFIGGYNRGGHYTDDAKNCVNRGGEGGDLTCPDGHVGGVDYNWREPVDQPGSACDGVRNENDTVAGTAFLPPQRRLTHVAQFALAIGGNYELTIPNVDFFRVFQPFVGGGVVLQWVYNYSDIQSGECYLIDNPDNDPFDPDNVDPWSDQGPEVGGEVYGGFHLNLGKVFRFAFEVGYQNVTIKQAPLRKATAEFQMQHLEYRLANLRLGGGIEFRF